jgi:hypothetical protein
VQCCINDSRNRIFTTEICALALHNREVHNGWNQFASTTRNVFFAAASAAARSEMKIPNVRLAVDWMYTTFQGVKNRAVYEPDFCNAERVETVVQYLMRQLESNYF